MDRSLKLPTPDYEADDVLVVTEPAQLRALGDDLRMKLVTLLRERAASTTELAAEVGLPKGTVGHHLKVLEGAGLVRVVRTRQVRALTEKYYGRTARLFVIKSGDEPVGNIAAGMLRQAAEEIGLGAQDPERATFSIQHVRLSKQNMQRFYRRLERLAADFEAAPDPGGDEYGLVLALYPTDRPDA